MNTTATYPGQYENVVLILETLHSLCVGDMSKLYELREAKNDPEQHNQAVLEYNSMLIQVAKKIRHISFNLLNSSGSSVFVETIIQYAMNARNEDGKIRVAIARNASAVPFIEDFLGLGNGIPQACLAINPDFIEEEPFAAHLMEKLIEDDCVEFVLDEREHPGLYDVDGQFTQPTITMNKAGVLGAVVKAHADINDIGAQNEHLLMVDGQMPAAVSDIFARANAVSEASAKYRGVCIRPEALSDELKEAVEWIHAMRVLYEFCNPHGKDMPVWKGKKTVEEVAAWQEENGMKTCVQAWQSGVSLQDIIA